MTLVSTSADGAPDFLRDLARIVAPHRISTRYNERFLPAATFGTFHETGHARYDKPSRYKPERRPRNYPHTPLASVECACCRQPQQYRYH